MNLKKGWLNFRRSFLGLQSSDEKEIKYHEVIERETQMLKKRRAKLKMEEPGELEDNKFGIALSGGGIRSATINLGFLETLNEFDILKRADYISTVSGGGYTGAYIQATLKDGGGDYSKLFDPKHIDHLRNNGEYMTPGKGIKKLFNRIILVIGFLISLLMSWLSPFIIGMMGYLGYLLLNHFGLDRTGYGEAIDFMFFVIIPIGLGLLFLHFILNVLLNYHLKLSNFFNRLEAYAIIILGFLFAGIFIKNLKWSWEWDTFGEVSYYLMIMFALGVLGYFANPNSLSFHRFYRNKLADAFLRNVKEPNILLQSLVEREEKDEDTFIHAPYPLINTCLNLLAPMQKKKKSFAEAKADFVKDGKLEQQVNFAGAKASDYFLLSPLFCGSKLAGYVPTHDTYNYRDLTLPAAATVSAAAVNPGMGTYSNKFLGLLTTIFNLRLGYWILNPKKNKLYDSLVWWPRYFVYELLGKIGMDNEMLNISDGGHIENLGIYELLRRRCKLIIAVDAEADPKFNFEGFENLAIRARNELGLEIRFAKPYLEDDIRPKPSKGYSNRRFAVGEIFQLWEELILRDDEQKVILGKNKKPIEVLINYKSHYLDDDMDDEKAIEEILSNVKTEIDEKLDNPTLAAEALENIKKIITKRLDKNLKIGTIVYVKSSVTAPEGKPAIDKEKDPLRYYTYKYKIYNPEFPHESTADQFFDPVQWTAYYELGRFIGGDVLGINNLDSFLNEMKKEDRPKVKLNELIKRRFGRRVKIFEEYKQKWEEEKELEAERLKEQLEKDFPMEKSSAPATLRELESKLEEADGMASASEEFTGAAEGEDLPAPSTLPQQKESDKIIVGKNVDYKM